MDIISLFTNQEQIAGLEISDSFLRLVYLSRDNKDQSTKITTYKELALKPGDLVNGIIINKDSFTSQVKKLVDKTDLTYAIISIPSSLIYSKSSQFSNTVTADKLESAMDLVINFQLPKDKSLSYIDWQKNDNKEKKETLLAAAAKDTVDAIVVCLELAGLKTVAVEFHAFSLGRILKKNDLVSAVLEKDETNLNISIYQGQELSFLHHAPFAKNSIAKEIKKVFTFYQFENRTIDKLFTLGDFNAKDLADVQLKAEKLEPLDLLKEKKLDEKYLVATGAALRGLIPRKNDSQISLMQIGTEERYAEQKAATFIDFLTKNTIGVCLFFIGAYFAGSLLMLSVQQNFNQRVESFQLTGDGAEFEAMQAKIASLNDLTIQTAGLARKETNWSQIVGELKEKMAPGITLTILNISSPEQPLSISGTAVNRNELNIFKNNLEKSDYFSAVNLPLDNLAKKDNIPFSISFSLENPQSIYTQ